MDDLRFDELIRRLGAETSRRGGLKAALGALLGGAAGAAVLDAEAKGRKNRGDDRGAGRDADADRKKKRKKQCKPACADGQRCVKGACVCDNGGTACGAECCALGQRCEGGQCATAPEPEPGQCIPAGEPCKGLGRACCDGRVCASGQGGMTDVACYAPKTGACATRTDCVYGMACVNGRCAPPAPVEQLGGACDAAAQQLCAYPGATCTAYTADAAPGGSYCTLPVGATCTGDPDCTCYKCFYPNGSVAGGGRSGRASANAKACCFPVGHECASESECCTGLSCTNGTCGGTLCAPEGGECTGDGDCCAGSCSGNVCSSAPACAPTFAVDGDPKVNGTKLQTAIDAMKPGDTVYLAPGLYQSTNSGAGSFGFTGVAGAGAYTVARCGEGVVELRDFGGGTYGAAVKVDGSSVTAGRLKVELRDITVGGHFNMPADRAKCDGIQSYQGGGITVSKADLVLSGASKITNACTSGGALVVDSNASVVMKDTATIIGCVGQSSQGGVRMTESNSSLALEGQATVTGNYAMAPNPFSGFPNVVAGGIRANNTTAVVTGATSQRVYGNFAPNDTVTPRCENYVNQKLTPKCVLP